MAKSHPLFFPLSHETTAWPGSRYEDSRWEKLCNCVAEKKLFIMGAKGIQGTVVYSMRGISKKEAISVGIQQGRFDDHEEARKNVPPR